MKRLNDFVLRMGRAVVVIALFGMAQAPPELWPEDADRRADLLGKEVVVDGRVAYVRPSPGAGYNAVVFKGSETVALLPPRLAFKELPKLGAARVRGTLRREGNRHVVDATGIEVFVDDRQRMRSAVAQLASTDFESRSGWARWAETRAEHYGDAELRSDGRALDAQALRAEGERPSAIEQPSVTWGIAKRGRARGVESPEPEALAHRALRQMLQGAKSEREVVAILSDARVFFPMAGATKAEGIERWQAAYQQSPADAYRSAPAAARAALDYMLIGDIQERLLRMRVGSLAPLERLKLIDEAEPLLGDRGSVVEGLRETALRELIADPGSLRQSDAFALAKHLREDLGRPDQSRAVLRGFLSWQRNRRLDANDATGRILLAGQFSELLEDRATAIELLQEAARLDIESKELADAFRRLGYVRSGSTFISSTSPPRGREGEPESGVARSRAPGGDPLTGLTPKEVRAQLGEPNAITRTATQGQIIEQWHYDEPKHQIIVISRRPGGTQGAVVGRYLVPR